MVRKMRTGMAQGTQPCEKWERRCKTWLGAAERMSLERVKTEGLVKERKMECVVARDRGRDGREVTAG